MRKTLVFSAAVVLAGVVVLSGCGPTSVKKYDAGISLQNAKKYSPAIQKYNEYLAEYKDSPLSPYALIGIARCYVGLGDKPAAMAAYQKVVAQHPDHDAARWAEIEMRELKGKKLVPVKKEPTKANEPKKR